MVDHIVLLCKDRTRSSWSRTLPISIWSTSLCHCFFTDLSQRFLEPGGCLGHCRILDPCVTRLLEDGPSSSHLIKENLVVFPHATSSSSAAAEIMIYSNRDRFNIQHFHFSRDFFDRSIPQRQKSDKAGLCRIVIGCPDEFRNPTIASFYVS